MVLLAPCKVILELSTCPLQSGLQQGDSVMGALLIENAGSENTQNNLDAAPVTDSQNSLQEEQPEAWAPRETSYQASVVPERSAYGDLSVLNFSQRLEQSWILLLAALRA